MTTSLNNSFFNFTHNPDDYVLRVVTDGTNKIVSAEKKGLWTWLKAHVFDPKSYKLAAVVHALGNAKLPSDDVQKINAKIRHYNAKHLDANVKPLLDWKSLTATMPINASEMQAALRAAGLEMQPTHSQQDNLDLVIGRLLEKKPEDRSYDRSKHWPLLYKISETTTSPDKLNEAIVLIKVLFKDAGSESHALEFLKRVKESGDGASCFKRLLQEPEVREFVKKGHHYHGQDTFILSWVQKNPELNTLLKTNK